MLDATSCLDLDSFPRAMDGDLAQQPDVSSVELNSTRHVPLQVGFTLPSVVRQLLLNGESYTHHSDLPSCLSNRPSTPCVCGIDEAGRGPVLGPMVYALLYLPVSSQNSLLAQTYRFNDSKVLTPNARLALMDALCDPKSELYNECGWATRVMSARDLSAGMLKAAGTYNLNAQAMDATVELIQAVLARGVNVQEIYIDTIGSPSVYQKRLERIFPTVQITVAKKADSLYPCVSAASVCAKVTRDAALQVSYEALTRLQTSPDTNGMPNAIAESWGSGYPSDTRCTTWLKQNMHPVFGWGVDCRFSWGTAKDLLETRAANIAADWPVQPDDKDTKAMDFSLVTQEVCDHQENLAEWFGERMNEEIF